MMISAYPEIYLDVAADNLGTMLDYAINNLKYNPDDFMDMFIKSGFAEQFSIGSPQIILGKSGRELCNDIYYKLTGTDLVSKQFDISSISKSEEYWAGWILAKYQWYSCQSFETIINCVKTSDIIKMYYPLHEAPEDKFFEILDRKLMENNIELFNKIDENYRIVNIKPYKNIYDQTFEPFVSQNQNPNSIYNSFER